MHVGCLPFAICGVGGYWGRAEAGGVGEKLVSGSFSFRDRWLVHRHLGHLVIMIFIQYGLDG